MATATQAAPRAEFKPEYGRAETIAFKFIEGKTFENSFGMRVMFTLTDERKLWVDAEDGSDIEHALREKGIERNQPFRITKIRHPRGGGHSFRVERVDDNAPAWVRDAATAPPSREEALLEKSLELARTRGAEAFQRNAHVLPPAAEPAPAAQPDDTARRLMSCFAASIEAITEAQAFADRKGLKVTFTSEDVRATAISAYIQLEKAALGVRY